MKWFRDKQPDFGVEFSDVLIRPQYSTLESRLQTSTCVCFGGVVVNPIIVANMITIASSAMYKALSMYGALVPLHRYASEDFRRKEAAICIDHNKSHVSITVGLNERDTIQKLLVEENVRYVFLELAHADNHYALEEVSWLKKTFPERFIIAGNVATYGAVKRLHDAGADAVKVGCGNGGNCRTRQVTGCGVPHLSAIEECSAYPIPIIADGGITSSGDIVKALAAGATMVMVGSLFAGTDEASFSLGDGTHIYHGMASKDAMELGGKTKDGIIPEGVSTVVKSVGPALKVYSDLIAGIRQGMGLVGARNIVELREKAVFQLVSQRTKTY